MSWTICYRPARNGTEVMTDIRTYSPEEAWSAWGDWRHKHAVWEYYSIHAQEVTDKVTEKPVEHIMPEKTTVMTHLYAVATKLATNPIPALATAAPAEPTPSETQTSPIKMSPTSFPGLQAIEIWPAPDDALPLPPPPSMGVTAAQEADPIAVDPLKWPTTAAFDRNDQATMYTWMHRAVRGYSMQPTKPDPGGFRRGTLAELTAIWQAIGASVHKEGKYLDMHGCYIKGRWAGMIRQDGSLHPEDYITTLPEGKS